MVGNREFTESFTIAIGGEKRKLDLGNIPAWKRNKPEAKELLCYMPILRSRSSRNSQEFRNLCRDVYQQCWNIVLQPARLNQRIVKGHVQLVLYQLKCFRTWNLPDLKSS